MLLDHIFDTFSFPSLEQNLHVFINARALCILEGPQKERKLQFTKVVYTVAFISVLGISCWWGTTLSASHLEKYELGTLREYFHRIFTQP